MRFFPLDSLKPILTTTMTNSTTVVTSTSDDSKNIPIPVLHLNDYGNYNYQCHNFLVDTINHNGFMTVLEIIQ